MPRVPARPRRRPLLLAVAMVAGLCHAAPAAAETAMAEITAAMQAAEQALKAGDRRAAMLALDNAIRANPGHAAARRALAVLYLQDGNAAAAERHLRQALADGLDEAEIAAPLAQALVMQGRLQEVLTTVPAGLRPPAVEGKVQLWHGYAHAARQAPEQAVRAFTESAWRLPEDPRPRLGLAQVLASQRQFAAAEQAADDALRVARKAGHRAEALALKGDMRRMAGDLDAARQLFAEALMTDPETPLALIGQAALLLREGKAAAAEVEARQVLAMVPDHPVALYLMAAAQAADNRFDEARATLAEAGDGYPPTLLLRASLALSQGDLAMAAADIARYRDRAGADIRSQRLEGALLLRRHDPAAAIAVLEEAAAAEPDDAQTAALLAAAHLQNNNHAAASEWLDRAAANMPRTAEALTRSAAGRLLLGQPDAAIGDLEEAARRDPEAVQARLLLILAHLRAGGHEAALQAVQGLAETMPDSPIPFNMAGGVHLARGDMAAARQSFEQALNKDPAFVPALVNLARLEQQTGHIAAAQAAFRQALTLESGNQPALLGLADLAVMTRQPEEALGWLEKAIAANTAAPEPRLRRIEVLVGIGQAARAVEEARALLGVAPGLAAGYEALGKAQWAAGQPQDALATFRRMAEIMPDAVPAHMLLANVLAAVGDLPGALASSRTAVDLRDDHLPARAQRLHLLVKAGQGGAALQEAEAWRDRHPDSGAGALLLADVLMRLGRPADAVPALAAEQARRPSSSLLLRLTEARVRSGEAERAVAELTAWLETHPEETAVRSALGGVHLRLGQHDQALAAYEAVTEADNAAVLNNLAWLYDRKGDPRALAMAERAYRLDPGSPAVADTLGTILVRHDQLIRGLALLRRAHRRAPDAPDIRYHLAQALALAGETEEARRLLDGLVADQADFEDAAAARDLHRRLTGG